MWTVSIIKRCINPQSCFKSLRRTFSTGKASLQNDQQGEDSAQIDQTQDYKEDAPQPLEPLYEGHIPTNAAQKLVLAAGSSLMSIVDPWRHDMVAVCGETTGSLALQAMHRRMRSSREGRRILNERPTINTKTVNYEELKKLPNNSFGYAYASFMESNNITSDSRSPVKFVDDPNLAYVMKRYREIHDIVHCLCDMKTNILGEVTIKWVEAIQTNLPMTWGAGILGSVRLSAQQRRLYRQTYLPWAIRCGNEASYFMNIYFERRWDQDLGELRKELKIPPLITRKT